MGEIPKLPGEVWRGRVMLGQIRYMCSIAPHPEPFNAGDERLHAFAWLAHAEPLPKHDRWRERVDGAALVFRAWALSLRAEVASLTRERDEAVSVANENGRQAIIARRERDEATTRERERCARAVAALAEEPDRDPVLPRLTDLAALEGVRHSIVAKNPGGEIAFDAWEYDAVDTKPDLSATDDERWMNARGEDGWMLTCAVALHNGWFRYYFKRQLREESKPSTSPTRTPPR